MKKLFTGCNVSRVVRLLIALAALVQGVIHKEGLLLAAGSWLLFGALFNLGCGGRGRCSVPTSTKKPNEEVMYEEVNPSK